MWMDLQESRMFAYFYNKMYYMEKNIYENTA